MHIAHLALLDYRSYAQVDLAFEPGVNVLVGANGAGKTNLIEAIGYLATLSSHRVAADLALIRQGADRAMIRGKVVRGERSQILELEIINGKANRSRINRGAPGRAGDILGILKTVVFAPEDLVLVKGDPSDRRRFLDELTVLMSPRMAAVFTDYDRIVRQRSALLKSAMAARRGGRAADLSTLDIWDAKLAETGAQIMAFREQFTLALAPHVAQAYEQVSDGPCDARISYRGSAEVVLGSAEEVGQADTDLVRSRTVAEQEAPLLDALKLVRDKELDRGVCLVGPHRDELTLELNGLPVKGYASHGESWSFALALRLGSFALMTKGPDHSDPAQADLAAHWWTDSAEDTEPVLILDDVFAELDGKRRKALAAVAAGAKQVIITAAVYADIPSELTGTQIHVAHGTVTRAHT